jgi:hypothetical protein
MDSLFWIYQHKYRFIVMSTRIAADLPQLLVCLPTMALLSPPAKVLREVKIYHIRNQLLDLRYCVCTFIYEFDISRKRDDSAACRRRAIRPTGKQNLWDVHTRWSIKMSFCPSAVNIKEMQWVILSTDVSSAFLMFLLLPSSVTTPLLRRSQIDPGTSDISRYMVTTVSSKNSNNISHTVRRDSNCKAGS